MNAKAPKRQGKSRRTEMRLGLRSLLFPWRLGALAFILFASLGATPATAPSTAPTTEPRGGRVTAPERRDLPGQRILMTQGELFVPDFFVVGEKTDVVVWFLGAPWIVEQEFYEARKNAVIFIATNQTIEANFPGPRHFDNLIANIQLALKKKEVVDKPIGKICLCSFSGGYTAIYQLLTYEETTARINDVVLCDSLYARHVAGPDSELDDYQMKPWVEFARRAAAGEKNFFFSQLYPPEEKYRKNTTTLTADYLIQHVGAKKVADTGKTSRGTPILYRSDMNGFHVLGYAGMTNQDHFDHLYAMHDLLKQTSLSDAKK
jgi:hypothetical protein